MSRAARRGRAPREEATRERYARAIRVVRSTVNYSTALRAGAKAATGRSRRRFFSPVSGRLVDSQPAVRGRLRGYRNHLTTSSRLGASPRPRAALSPSRDNCPFLDRARLSVRTIARSLTLTVTRCVAFAPVPGVNVVKIRSLIDNSIARAR